MSFVLPVRFRDADIGNVDTEVYGASVIAYKNSLKERVSHGRGLLLSGPPGVGKTYAMAALTKFYMSRLRRHPYVVFETVYSVLDKYSPVASAAEQDPDRGQSWTKTYETCSWLVLNDLGKDYRGGKLAEQVAYKIGRLIRTRSENMLVTHITTNLPLMSRPGYATFKDVYGESLWSLLAEMMNRFEVDGPDWRRGIQSETEETE